MANTSRSRVLVLLIPLLMAPLAAQQQNLTLQQAVAVALAQNPATRMASANVAIAQAGQLQSKALLLPQISFSERLTRGNDPVYAFGTKLRQQVFQQSDFNLSSLNRPSPIDNFSTSFAARWTMFDSLLTQRQIARASQLKQSAEASADRTGQETIYQVVSAYEAVLVAAREVEVASHAVTTAQALYDLSCVRVNAGFSVESDVLSAQVNLAARQQDLIRAEGAEQTAWAELEAAVGAVIPKDSRTVEQLTEHDFSVMQLQYEVEQAVKNRPDLKGLALQVSAQQSAVKSVKSEFGPRVETFGSWQTDRHSFAGTGGSSWLAGAELRVDLLPFEKRSRLDQEKASLLRLQAGEASARNLIRVEVSRAYYSHQAAGKMVEVARSTTAQAAESLRILRNRYDAGLTTLTDVLRAEDAERQSQSGYWQAVYQNALSYAALRLATGNLNTDLVRMFQ